MDARDLKGLPVVAIDGGERLGAITDVLFNLDDRRIAGFAMRSGGRIGGTTAVIPLEQVHSVGADALMVQDRTALEGDESAHRYRQYPTLADVTSLRVVTDTGTVVGSLVTARVDESTGAITDLEIAQRGLSSLFRSHLVIPIGQVVSIGRDVVVIPEALIEAGEETGGAPEPQPEAPEADEPAPETD